MKYEVSLTKSALDDMAYFRLDEQRLIRAGIISHLTTEAETATRRKKPLRPNLISPWELRLDKFRVFYSIEADENARAVKVVAVGHKEHNDLFIRGEKVQL